MNKKDLINAYSSVFKTQAAFEHMKGSIEFFEHLYDDAVNPALYLIMGNDAIQGIESGMADMMNYINSKIEYLQDLEKAIHDAIMEAKE